MKVLVADDEQPARRRLCQLLHEIDPQIAIVEARDGLEALELASLQSPQVALLDIRMPGLDGIGLAKRLEQLDRPPTVVFVTAFDQHALAAFEANGIAYLMKPIRVQQLREALHKAVLLHRAQHATGADSAALGQEPALSATLGGRLQRIPLSQVICLRADQKYVEVVHQSGTALLDESLKSLEQRFPEQFLRVHRNALVAPERLRTLERAADGVMLLSLQGCELRLEVSRRHLAEVRRRMRDQS